MSTIALFAATSIAHAEEKITYDDHVGPLLRQHCGSCHNPTARKSGLDVTNYVSLMEGGASGASIEPGDASASYLFSLVAREAEPFMPPNAEKIPDAQLQLLRDWIDGGAPENSGSKAMKKKPGVDLAVEVDPGTRPEIVPMPPRMVLEPHYELTNPPMARSLATSPWAPIVALTSQRQVLLYHTKTLELLGALDFPEGQPNVVRFSRDGRLLLVGGGRPAASGKVVVWDITTGERVFEVGDELDVVLAADISADYKRIVLGGPQRLVRVYSAESGELLHEINKHTEWVTAVEFSPDGILLATGDRNGGIHLWEAHTGNEYLTLDGHTAAVTGVSWRSDSNVLASVSEDAAVRLWEPVNGSQVKTWNAKSPILAVEFARDGRLVTSGRDQITRLWDQQGKQLVETSAIGDIAVSVAFCDETNRLITASWKGAVHVYEAQDAAERGNLATNPPTLADRLATAENQVADANTALQPLREAAQNAEEALVPATAELAAAKQGGDEQSRAVADLAARVKRIESQRTTKDDERRQLGKQLALMEQTRPSVGEALRHLTEALGKAPDDAAIGEAHRQLTEKLAAMDKGLAELRSSIANVHSTLAQHDAELKDTNAQLNAARDKLATAEKEISGLEAKHKQLNASLNAAREAAEPIEARLADAKEQVERWRGEIEFRDKMTALIAELTAANEQAAAREAEVEEARQALAAAQARVETAAAQHDEAAKGVAAVRAKIDAARDTD